MLAFLAWCLLFVFCWPLAILALVLWPLFWLLSLPFRLLAISFDAVFALLRAVLFLRQGSRAIARTRRATGSPAT